MGGCETSISAAVAKITQKSAIIFVAAGTYHDNVSINTGREPKELTLTIIGNAGAATTVIDGDAAGAIFTIGSKANVSLYGLTLTDGSGGPAEGGTGGGGILATGAMLSLYACMVDGNEADIGAGIYASDGNLTIDNSSITNNLGQGNDAEGGGIYFTSKRSHRLIPYKLKIFDSTIDANSATFGGGVFLAGWGLPLRLSAEITDSVISNNVSLTTADASGQGAGVWFSFARLTITNTTISGNNASGVMGRGGGILPFLCDATLNNVTIANNSAGGEGGGIGGVFVGVIGGGADLRLLRFVISNSIVAGNHAAQSPDCQSGTLPIVSHDYNFIGDVTGCTLRDKTAHNIYYGDPLLGPLMNNGGTTDTQALLPGSLALGTGNPGVPNGKDGRCAAADQIGTARSKGDCDMGAYQLPD
ncbi:MAG: choice-of-anchor Q domain-containing protein [Candidatus Binataceae bacterium]|jgi:hypothetical protein